MRSSGGHGHNRYGRGDPNRWALKDKLTGDTRLVIPIVFLVGFEPSVRSLRRSESHGPNHFPP